MARNRKQPEVDTDQASTEIAVYFYRSGALTSAQTDFVNEQNATVLEAYTSEQTGRNVFAHEDVAGYKECPNAELLTSAQATIESDE